MSVLGLRVSLSQSMWATYSVSVTACWVAKYTLPLVRTPTSQPYFNFLWGEVKKIRLGQYARFPCTLLECRQSQSDGSCHMIVDL